ncbi:uncharacterized protein DFL_004800 [Arthrobotrys flagrans]|uniref:J domain-containing protein n=1 Tax=Arthrobotrys flagrans TaxID=97331 RepID=A0A437A5X3_ARTFL|nr:hypothetical protein DFL_004800 [Arthrobotrys flagrans]
MPSESEAIEFANSPISFYELLSLETTAQAKDVRRAYRKTALQYHPDKNPDNPSAVEKFHLLTAAQEILCDAALRAAYDNALAAKVAKKRRAEAYDTNRRQMKEELEARENSFKRQKTDADEKKRELERLKEEGTRRRKEMDERKKREAAMEEEEEKAVEMEVDQDDDQEVLVGESKFSELDRTLKVKWRRKGAGEMMDKAGLIDLFSRFGKIDECVVVSGSAEKEKKYASALLIFHNIAHAYAAVHRDKKALEEEDDEWGIFRDVVWASGKEPDLMFKKSSKPTETKKEAPPPKLQNNDSRSNPQEAKDDEQDKFPTFSKSYKPTLKSTPSFSFKASSFRKPTTSTGSSSRADEMDFESVTLMRMKAKAAERRQAEQQKLTEELLKREAEEEKAE